MCESNIVRKLIRSVVHTRNAKCYSRSSPLNHHPSVWTLSSPASLLLLRRVRLNFRIPCNRKLAERLDRTKSVSRQYEIHLYGTYNNLTRGGHGLPQTNVLKPRRIAFHHGASPRFYTVLRRGGKSDGGHHHIPPLPANKPGQVVAEEELSI